MPCSLVQIYKCSGGTYCLHLQGRDIQSTMNHEAIGSTAMFVNFDQINHACIPKEGTTIISKPKLAITNQNTGRFLASFNNNIHATHYFSLLYMLKK
jgi:hypothetical protein